MRLVFWISLTTDSARCNEPRERRALRSNKYQIDWVLSRIFIHSRCKVRSHNRKGGCACREKKKNPWFRSHILSKVMNIFTSQNLITENGSKLNSFYWYNTIVRCKHLVARIFQHGFKLSSWVQVNKKNISNQIAHHQPTTKFASMLEDIKKITSL